MLVLSSVLVLRNAAHLTPPASCWWLACSTRITLAPSPLHGYCVVCGMFLLTTSLPWRPGILTPHVLLSLPVVTLTSKGPLNYMTEPLRTFHFILSCSHALYALFLQMVSNFPKGPFSKHQCMPSSVWHTTFSGSLHFNFQFNFRVCPRG